MIPLHHIRKLLAGIYIHIPFCKQACHYCDFHFSTNLSRKRDLVSALVSELNLRKDEFSKDKITSIYFGGGTPSLLSEEELQHILEAIHQQYSVEADSEITLEANPDDLTRHKLEMLKRAGINRLSIGIQTFNDEKLKFMNRAHSSLEAQKCLELANETGFDNISADLIYAIPPAEEEVWSHDLEKLLSFAPPHISLYGLTIEEKTAFGNWARRGKLQEVDEQAAAQQYRYAVSRLKANGYEHYEVSNFATKGNYSRHNSAYWDDQKYLGIGPGAHSYDGDHRSYNVSNNAQYIKAIGETHFPRTIERLTKTEKINDYLFTHLRTNKGVDLEVFENKFHKNLATDYKIELNDFISQKLVSVENGKLILTSEGFMLADEITYRLFYVD